MAAPTGAGKTNVALLTVLRLVNQKLDANNGILDLFPQGRGVDKGKGKGKEGKKGGKDKKKMP